MVPMSGPEVDDEAAVGGPRGIDRELADQCAGRPTVDRHAKEVWNAAFVRRRR
jgi:hypothetical protein